MTVAGLREGTGFVVENSTIRLVGDASAGFTAMLKRLKS